jgi:ribosome biogenesis GTPase
VKDISNASDLAPLSALGWSKFFEEQLELQEAHLVPCRISSVHRARLSAISQTGGVQLSLSPQASTGDFAVGDWVLANPETATPAPRP